MSFECAKCKKKFTHNEDTLECSACATKFHFYCTRVTEANFNKKMLKTQKPDFRVLHAKTLIIKQ